MAIENKEILESIAYEKMTLRSNSKYKCEVPKAVRVEKSSAEEMSVLTAVSKMILKQNNTKIHKACNKQKHQLSLVDNENNLL